MKKLVFLITTLLVVALVGAGCHRDDPTPTPTPDTYAVVYKIGNSVDDVTMSPCFKMNVTYTDANGQQVTENNVTLPWTKTVEIKLPFHAKLTGQLTYNEEELPDHLVYVLNYGMGLYVNGVGSPDMTEKFSSATKENFLIVASEHPEWLQFTQEKDF